VLTRYPRLALLRCVALTVCDEIAAAKRVYRAAAARTAGFMHDREGGDDTALQDDHVLAHGLIEMCGCEPFGGPMSEMLPMAIAMAEGSDVPPLNRGIFSLGICMVQNQRTEFGASVEWAVARREGFAPIGSICY